jgi:hypothetical protein
MGVKSDLAHKPEEHRFSAYENWVLRRIFGPKRNEVQDAGKDSVRKLGNMYPSPSTIRVIKSGRIKWVGHVAGIGDIKNAYKILVG